MDYGNMREREAIDLLDIIYDALEDEWSDNTILARYLEAIDHAQDALRDQLHTQEDALRDQLVRDAIHTQETTA